MKIIEWFKARFGKRAIGINTPGFLETFALSGGIGTASGVRVSEQNALNISTVFQCVRIISDSIGQIPFGLFREVRNGREKAIDHPLHRVLHRAPNPLVPAFVFKKTLQAHLMLWGNAFAEIERNGAGEVVALWPLLPNRMRLQLFRGRLFYYYTMPDGEEEQLTDVLHLRGLSSDGLVGYSPISLHREKLGLAKASEEYRARFFGNDATPGGFLKHPQSLSKEAKGRLITGWEQRYQGVGNRRRIAVLDEGMEWESAGIPPKDAEFIQGEEFTKADIAAIYGVPPYKIGLLKAGTVSFASVEQQAIDFVVDGVAPWVVSWENSCDQQLLTPTEQEIYFTKFTMQALLRGDSASRGEFYAKMLDRGVFSINDILELEDRNTIGAIGDKRFIPLNTIPLDMVEKFIESKINGSGDGDTDPAPTQDGNGNGARNIITDGDLDDGFLAFAGKEPLPWHSRKK